MELLMIVNCPQITDNCKYNNTTREIQYFSPQQFCINAVVGHLTPQSKQHPHKSPNLFNRSMFSQSKDNSKQSPRGQTGGHLAI